MINKILVCGGRDYSDRERVFEILDMLRPCEIVHGAYRGADSLAGEWADSRVIPQSPHPADWDKYKRRAGPIRNSEMLRLHKNIDLVVAFPGGSGTQDMRSKARLQLIPILDVI